MMIILVCALSLLLVIGLCGKFIAVGVNSMKILNSSRCGNIQERQSWRILKDSPKHQKRTKK